MACSSDGKPRESATGPGGHAFRIGDRVRCPKHSQGTVWDNGWIEAFTPDGRAAFLVHGSPDGFWGLRGTRMPVPLKDLLPY